MKLPARHKPSNVLTIKAKGKNGHEFLQVLDYTTSYQEYKKAIEG